jgi:hypothetical protein
MLGAAGAWVRGDWLLKAEGAYLDGLRFFNAPGQTWERMDLMVGFENSSLRETTFVFEAVVRHLYKFDDLLALAPDDAEENRVEWIARASRSFLHQTLTLTVVALVYGEGFDEGGLQRLEARYDATDRLEVTGGVVFYQSGLTPGFETLGDNDRLFLDVVYRF